MERHEQHDELIRLSLPFQRGVGKGKQATNMQAYILRCIYSVSQPLSDRGPVNSFFIRRGPGPSKFTHKYISNFFLSLYVKLT